MAIMLTEWLGNLPVCFWMSHEMIEEATLLVNWTSEVELLNDGLAIEIEVLLDDFDKIRIF